MPAQYLRRIVLMEARARPKLKKIEGLWRKRVKGCRGATPKPGSMTEYIRMNGLLASDEIERIVILAVDSLTRWLDAVAAMPAPRPELAVWLKQFDAVAAAGMHDPVPFPAGPVPYSSSRPEGVATLELFPDVCEPG